MPAVFQRLSDSIRVIMLRRTSVNALLGMLDDFVGVVYVLLRIAKFDTIFFLEYLSFHRIDNLRIKFLNRNCCFINN